MVINKKRRTSANLIPDKNRLSSSRRKEIPDDGLRNDYSGDELYDLSPLEKLRLEFEKHLDRPSVSLIIVNRNGIDLLRHSLFALQTQSYPLEEIIMIDNGSADDSVPYVRSLYPTVKILESAEDLGYAMAVNLGARCATGDLIAVLGNNMVPTPGWLGRLVVEFQRGWPGVGVVSSWRSTGLKLGQYAHFYHEINFIGCRIECISGNERTCFSPEGSAFICARYLNLDGPFDPDFRMGQDDIYLGWKTRMSGKQVLVAMDAKVFQKENPNLTLYPQWKRIYFENRNRWMSLLIFYEGRNLVRVFPWVVLDMVFRLLTGLATSLSGLMGTLLAVGWIFFNPVRIFSKRKLIQEKREISDDEITPFMTGKIMSEKSRMADMVNGLSLAYCRWCGLRVMENWPNKV